MDTALQRMKEMTMTDDLIGSGLKTTIKLLFRSRQRLLFTKIQTAMLLFVNRPLSDQTITSFTFNRPTCLA